MANFSKIIGTGSYLPSRIVTNDELSQRIDTTDEWIKARTGIAQRHVVADNESTTDLAENAARQALMRAGIAHSELDLIVIATTTPDKVFPSVASTLQHRLGANGCAAFDVQAVCCGFIYALSVADQFIRTGEVKNALVIGAEAFSRILDWNDRSTCVLFGDGSGAVVLQKNNVAGILATQLHADGKHEELLHVPGNRSIYPDQEPAFVHMKGKEVFREAVEKMSALLDTTLQKGNMDRSDIVWMVPHQANLRIIKALAKKLGISMDSVVVTVNKHANTSAASIPLALNEAVSDGRIKEGEVVLMEAFGGGFTWGSALVRM